MCKFDFILTDHFKTCVKLKITVPVLIRALTYLVKTYIRYDVVIIKFNTSEKQEHLYKV